MVHLLCLLHYVICQLLNVDVKAEHALQLVKIELTVFHELDLRLTLRLERAAGRHVRIETNPLKIQLILVHIEVTH